MPDIKIAKQLANKSRLAILNMCYKAKTSHIGSCFSCVDILAVLYECVLKIDPQDPNNVDQDCFIMSKGHAAAALYAILGEKNFFPKVNLEQYATDDSFYSGHASHHVPGVIFSTGSLGHGLSLSFGLGLAKKKLKSSSRIYCLVSDGELNEGSVWEAFFFGKHNSLNNVTCIIDKNNLQGLGATNQVLDMGKLEEILTDIGYKVFEVDGHNHVELLEVLYQVTYLSSPAVIIANTIKGKGVSFMENNNLWHYKSLDEHAYRKAILELQNYA